MGKIKLTFAVVISVIVLLIYTYITFMGLDYLNGGNLLLPTVLAIGFFILVAACIVIMCISKATRWHRIGIIGQVFFGVVILAAFIASSIPFTNFMRVVHDKSDIAGKVQEACNSAISLDSAYANYVDNRIANYKEELSLISRGKNINPTRYQECLGKASGNNDEARIEKLAKSLHNKLLPESTEKIVKERHSWLENAKNANVWNPSEPSNINKIDEQVNGWLSNYKVLSSVSYQGENASPFEYERFSSSLSTLTALYSTFKKPSFEAFIIAILCFIIMLLPYFITKKSLASASSGKEGPIFE